VRLAGLYAVTPDWPDSKRMIAAVEAALAGGAALVQLRRKRADHGIILVEAREIAALCRHHGAYFIVNDDPVLARDCGADGVHLGSEDAALAAAREILGPGRLIGVSCYDDLKRVRAAELAGADYAAIGSMFPSATKPAAIPASLAVLAAARRQFKIPLAGIGGIDVRNASQVKSAGADMLAVIGSLFESETIEETARKFSALWN
jgi:thiamine-phosphate pyrophosphorylase